MLIASFFFLTKNIYFFPNSHYDENHQIGGIHVNEKSKTSRYLLIGVYIILFIFVMQTKEVFNDSDTFWHIELGRYMLEHNTVLTHAIHSFVPTELAYVPHEFGFQILIALLFNLLGWSGTYILSAICLFFVIYGMYTLTTLSRREVGYRPHHLFSIILIMPLAYFIYNNYFSLRPQIVSSALIIWFFIFMRGFTQDIKKKHFVILPLFSCLLANIHAGVWIVLPVFLVMTYIELVVNRTLRIKHHVIFLLTLCAGLLNVGGAKSIFYFFTITKGGFNKEIMEWAPVDFSSFSDARTVLLLTFIGLIPFVLHKKVFRYFFMLGILFLGVSNYKENLYLWLFFPYFVATVFDQIPIVKNIKTMISNKLVLIALSIGIGINIFSAFIYPTDVNVETFPVQEMDYVLKQTEPGTRPKVLAHYNVSGYVMSRGADILADGRQDPFITDESKGVYDWNAFERSIRVQGFHLPEIANFDKPDYIIVHSSKEDSDQKLIQSWITAFGEPVFKGDYGLVFKFSGGTI